MNVPRIVLFTILLLSLFLTAKSFVAVQNYGVLSDDLRSMVEIQLMKAGVRPNPVQYFLRRMEAIEQQWTAVRSVSIASAVLACIGLFLVSLSPRAPTAGIAQAGCSEPGDGALGDNRKSVPPGR